MIFRIKNRRDGTFRCWAASGRKISGTYKRQGQETRPYLLELLIFTKDPEGQDRFLLSATPVTGYLAPRQIQDLAEALDRNAQAVERGAAPSGDFEQAACFRESATWRKFLFGNREFLMKNPQYLADLDGPDSTE
jgi:hypothetical protein